jgi:hypothetical protein
MAKTLCDILFSLAAIGIGFTLLIFFAATFIPRRWWGGE